MTKYGGGHKALFLTNSLKCPPAHLPLLGSPCECIEFTEIHEGRNATSMILLLVAMIKNNKWNTSNKIKGLSSVIELTEKLGSISLSY